MKPTPLYSADGTERVKVLLPSQLPEVVIYCARVFVLRDGRYIEATCMREPAVARNDKGDRL